MSNGMPELGSKISLISKADIRYEGRLFTVDPQECTIALSAVRSFGTEDRETQCPVPAQSQVYDYILFRGSDIKDIRVLNNVPQQTFNDPAIMQLSVPPTWANQQQQFGMMGQHMPIPPMGQYAPFGGIPTSAPGMPNQSRKPSFLDNIIGGGASRSTTPASQRSHKSGVDQGIQAGGNKSSSSNSKQQTRNSNSRDRKDSSKSGGDDVEHHGHHRNNQHHHHHNNRGGVQQNYQQRNYQNYGGYQQRGNWNRGTPRMTRGGGISGRSRGGNVGVNNYHRPMNTNNGLQNNSNNANNRKRNTLKFDKDYDFEQANSEFAELRSQFAKVKIDEVSSTKLESNEQLEPVPPTATNGEHEKKDDSGNETGAGETEVEEENQEVFYDKKKSFFDKISCEAIERAKGKMQRTDWRQERKLNSETFGVSATRRGNFRGRGIYRGGYNNRGGYRPNYRQNQEHQYHQQQQQPQQHQRKEQGNVTYPILNYNAPDSGEKTDETKQQQQQQQTDKDEEIAVDLTDLIEVCPGLGEGPVDATNHIEAN